MRRGRFEQGGQFFDGMGLRRLASFCFVRDKVVNLGYGTVEDGNFVTVVVHVRTRFCPITARPIRPISHDALTYILHFKKIKLSAASVVQRKPIRSSSCKHAEMIQLSAYTPLKAEKTAIDWNHNAGHEF